MGVKLGSPEFLFCDERLCIFADSGYWLGNRKQSKLAATNTSFWTEKFSASKTAATRIPGYRARARRLHGGGMGRCFRPGPIFTQVLLADELNRATPRTQSGLLEAMEEHTITADRKHYSLPKPFFVISTDQPQTITTLL